tara:strand:+ start:662 stop:1129 length:468 start_codon:yes stop_codon:yes gene_type:complete
LCTGRFDLGLALNFDFSEFGLPCSLALFCETGFFRLTGGSEAGFFLRFALETRFFSPTDFGFLHPAASVFFLAPCLFFALKKGCASSTLPSIIGLKATTLALDFGELTVKFSTRGREVGPCDTGTQPFGHQTLSEVDAGVASEHQTQDTKAECGT